jgi:uncharacterized protein (DUF2461 family)
MNIPLPAHVLEYLRPYRDTDFSQVRLPEQKHQGARLPDATANAQWNFVAQDRLVVGILQEI